MSDQAVEKLARWLHDTHTRGAPRDTVVTPWEHLIDRKRADYRRIARQLLRRPPAVLVAALAPKGAPTP